MASPGNRHFASCINALSFLIALVWSTCGISLLYVFHTSAIYTGWHSMKHMWESYSKYVLNQQLLYGIHRAYVWVCNMEQMWGYVSVI